MKRKRVLRNLVIILSAVALLAWATGTIRMYSFKPDVGYVARVEGYLKEGAVTRSELERVLGLGAPFKSGYWQVCVAQVGPVSLAAGERVTACHNSMDDGYISGDTLGLLPMPLNRMVFARNGSVYNIEFGAQPMPKWSQLTLFLLLIGGIVGAWITLALWVFADARDRLAKAPAGWALISVLTGPVGLAVWLVVRGEQPSDLCPQCGTRRVPGTAFCVSCGQSLDLRCPACGKPVSESWAHCGACGAAMIGSGGNGGGGDRILADENRAG